MSLNWEFTDKEKFKAMSETDKKYNDAFVWGCLLVDMSNITEQNAKEWLIRYRLYSKVFGPFVYTDKEKQIAWIPRLEDVKKRTGLQCNVSYKSKAQFMTKLFKHFSDDIEKETRESK